MARSASTPRIAVVAADALARAGLAGLLAGAGGNVVGQAAPGPALPRPARRD